MEGTDKDMINTRRVEAWDFLDAGQPYINIADEQAYDEAHEMLEQVLKSRSDEKKARLDSLVKSLKRAIDLYEAKDNT